MSKKFNLSEDKLYFSVHSNTVSRLIYTFLKHLDRIGDFLDARWQQTYQVKAIIIYVYNGNIKAGKSADTQ